MPKGCAIIADIMTFCSSGKDDSKVLKVPCTAEPLEPEKRCARSVRKPHYFTAPLFIAFLFDPAPCIML
jgi:hypothetical protein